MKDYIGWAGAPKYIGQVGWNPSMLFAAGEEGVWYDPSDLSTLYQDSAGTTPVTALGQPVGLMLDKSGRGNHASQPTATGRPTLQARVNLLTGTDALHTAPSSYYVSGTGVAPVPVSGIEAPDGSLTAVRIKTDRGASDTSADRSIWKIGSLVSVVTGETYTASAWVKAAAPSEVGKVIRFGVESGSIGNIALPAEWTLVSRTTVAAMTGRVSFILESRGGSYGNSPSAEFLIWHPQAEVGSTPTTYQRVTSAADYADVGAPRKIDYDGVDDKLRTTFPDLGTAVTIVRSVPGTGASILTGQTIGAGARDDSTDHHGLLIINRALTAPETTLVTKWANLRAGI